MYDIETLSKCNPTFVSEHFRITSQDVEMANTYIERIESTRDSSRPKAGDIIRYINKYSEYYPCAHIERVNLGTLEICQQPYVPFIQLSDDGISCSTSGGAWDSLDLIKLKYVGTEKKLFKDFGSCGVRAHGAIYFEATVNVWEYTSENLRYGQYTTKDWNRDLISYCKTNKEQSPYHYFGNGRAFISEQSYLAWLLTYKGVEFEGWYPTQTVVFFYRKQERLVSRDEWEHLDLPIDTRRMNASILFIKYLYDDIEHIIYEYRYGNSGESEQYIKHPYYVARQQTESGEYKRIICSHTGNP